MNALLVLVLLTGDAEPVAFETGIMPVLTKSGCNTGACHGAAIGRGGFRLSLYGSNPDADYDSIVYELEGRRVNPASPAESLIVLKATETIEHGGGTRFNEDHPSAVALRNWIAAGVPRATRALVRFEVAQPRESIQIGAEIPLSGRAIYGNGDARDVSRWMVVTSADDFRTEVTGTVVRPVAAGRHLVTVRYRDRVVPVELVIPFGEVADKAVEPANFVDELLSARLRALGLPESPACDDHTFLRRASLALTGRLPAQRRIEEFVADPSANKRQELIDTLIESDACTDLLTWRFAELLRIKPTGQEKIGARVYHDWLRAEIAANTGYDEIARQLLTSLGDSHEIGAANFHRTAGNAREQAELISEVLMGVRLRCANCHDHPLDHWKQDDYHGLAAMFVRLDRSRIVKQKRRGEVTHPRTGLAAVPRLPSERFLDPNDDSRAVLADWMVDASNPYFSKAIVNRIWKWTMGRGLVEPVDDMRSTNPASHPELLDALADDFVRHGFDIRRTVRLICTSNAFGRSATATGANATDREFFSHFLPTRLGAQVVMDAIADATLVPRENGRALLDFDPTTPDRSLDVLGRCGREAGCDAGGDAVGGLPVQLHLLNSRLLNDRLQDPISRLSQLTSSGENEKLRTLYYVTLSRPPRPAEIRFWREQIRRADNQEQVWQDVFWSLLNCDEFVTNH